MTMTVGLETEGSTYL